VATATQVEEYRQGIDDLTALAFDDLRVMLETLDTDAPTEVRDTLIEVMPAVVQPYVTAAGEVSATWYEDLRNDAVGSSLLPHK
jgi:hypothetical protein